MTSTGYQPSNHRSTGCAKCHRRWRISAATRTAQATQIGLIQLTDFVNPAGLQARGETSFETGASGNPLPGNPGLNGLGTLQQGYVAGSNVNVVEEMVNMIETQRAYDEPKAISTADQMLQYVTQNYKGNGY